MPYSPLPITSTLTHHSPHLIPVHHHHPTHPNTSPLHSPHPCTPPLPPHFYLILAQSSIPPTPQIIPTHPYSTPTTTTTQDTFHQLPITLSTTPNPMSACQYLQTTLFSVLVSLLQHQLLQLLLQLQLLQLHQLRLLQPLLHLSKC